MTDDILAKHRGIIYKSWFQRGGPYVVIKVFGKDGYNNTLIEVKLLNNNSFQSTYQCVTIGHAIIQLYTVEQSKPITNYNTNNIMEYVKALVLKP